MSDIIVIDKDLRTMQIPSTLKLLGVESDDSVNRINFCLPREYNGFDLSEFVIRINYMNANNEGDVYLVDDAHIQDDNIYFSWLVGRNACEYKGNVKFIVCLKKVDGNAVVTQEFNTTVHKLPVLEGLETSEAVIQENPDIFEQLLLQINTALDDLDDEIVPAVNNWLSDHPEVTNGQPVPVTLASQMTETSGIYLYLGSETGYDYGYIYIYQNNAWTKTNLYGKGQDGEDGVDGSDGSDGFSPVATVTQTATGASISVTDKNGTTIANVDNGTATDTQVAAWLENHPEATTTVQDGAITAEKLSQSLYDEVFDKTEENIPVYENEVIYNLRDLTQLVRGTMSNGVFTPSDSGNFYATPYISVDDFYERGMVVVKSGSRNPTIWYYDANKAFISSTYGAINSATATFPEGTAYFLYQGVSDTYYGDTYNIQGSKQKTFEVSKAYSKGTNTYNVVEKTITVTYDSSRVPSISEISIIPGETYTISTQGYAVWNVMNEASIANSITNRVYASLGGNSVSNVSYTVPVGATKLVNSSGNANVKFIITGKFVETAVTMPSLELVASNFSEDSLEAIADGLGLHEGQSVNEIYYNCTHYGVIPANADNTSALNTLISTVSANGGGVIWIPNGTYNFNKDGSTSAMSGNAQNNVYLKSNVSIIGESLDSTIFKLSGSTQTGCSLFGYFESDNSNNPLVGCTFSNFTVDMSALTMSTYSHKGKAFYVSGIKDCIFRDLRLLSTPSTALGIDMLDNVVIDSVYVYQGGRQWSSGGNGGAGIGIGTGKWTNENYIIRNCICDSCGHFGIFLEDQGLFNSNVRNYSKGQIIANNIIRNGNNYGIGLRGGRYVSITGNNIYSNANGGIYLDYGADKSMISNNIISDETNAINFGNESNAYACTNIAVINNVFAGCTNGVIQTLTPTNSVIQNNVTV